MKLIRLFFLIGMYCFTNSYAMNINQDLINRLSQANQLIGNSKKLLDNLAKKMAPYTSVDHEDNIFIKEIPNDEYALEIEQIVRESNDFVIDAHALASSVYNDTRANYTIKNNAFSLLQEIKILTDGKLSI